MHNEGEIAIDSSATPIQSLGLLLHDLAHDPVDITGGERLAVSEQRVQRRTQSVDVGPGADLRRAAGRLLRRHERGRAEHCARLRELRVHRRFLGQPEVHDEDVGRIAVLHHEVHGLEITVDDAEPVGVLEGQRGVPDEQDEQAGITESGVGGVERSQRVAADSLHGEKVGRGIEHGGDVRVDQAGCGLRFSREALPRLVGEPGRRAEQLQRHVATQFAVVGLVDDAHSSPTQLSA